MWGQRITFEMFSGGVLYPGWINTCHRLIRRQPLRKFFSRCHQTSGTNHKEACKQHVAADRKKKGEAAINNEQTEVEWACRLSCWVSKVESFSPHCHHLDDPERRAHDGGRQECLTSLRPKLGGQLQRPVTMPTGGGAFYKKPGVCYFT